MLVLVTGATGFLGNAVLARCGTDSNFQLRGSSRRDTCKLLPGIETALVADLAESTDWSRALRGVEAVVHTAARVHVMHDTASDSLAEFRRVNVAGTLNLARQAAAAGVRRFVFISSIKVNGEQTAHGRVFAAGDVPAPSKAYGMSKHEAEQGLRRLAATTGLEVVIIRPVLVYGPGVKGNFLSMMRWVHNGMPLPLGAIHNRRSLVALDNLTDLIVTCLRHPAAANQTFLVSDGEDVSTTVLLRRVAVSMGVAARLIPIPESVLSATMRLFQKAEMAQRLCASLEVNIGKTRQQLDWTPSVNMDYALCQTARWFLKHGADSHRSAPLDRE
jgi:nucleoside-diphosphate-sugar epimerase